MAIHQSGWATRQRNTATSGIAGAEVAQVFEFTLPADALPDGDIIELGVLPAHNAISGAYLVSDAAGGVTVDVGLMSGGVGEEDNARTCGDEIFSGQVVTDAVTATTLVTAYTIEPAQADRAVGVLVTTAGSAAPGEKIRLLLKYRAV